MYPFLRMAHATSRARRAPPAALTETLVTRHMIMPWDLDMWRELNNGRTLTLFDLGRLPMLIRTGLYDGLRPQGWMVTVAGSSVRYRARLRAFDRVEMRSRILGWDRRFFYTEQSLWRDGSATTAALVRLAVAGEDGIAPPEEVLRRLDRSAPAPQLPAWVAAWAEADGTRPWPPQD